MTFTESMLNAFIWYVAITAAGLLAFPLLFQVCRGLPDRGASLHRPAGLALIPLPAWAIGNLIGIPFNPLIVIVSALLIGVPAWIFALYRSDILSFLRDHFKPLLAFECATLLLFLGYVVFRGFNPDIAGTEKPMELTFLNASIRSSEIPVEDPWFAGESINYYYYGYVVLAAVAKVTTIPGEVAFNLGLATAFSLATVAAGGLAANLSKPTPGNTPIRRVAAGALAGFLLSLGGNLHAAFELIRNPGETLRAGWWEGIGWTSSRVIQDTGFPGDVSRTVITEFPAFSWILGDLHPHVITLPWVVTALALTVNQSIILQRHHTSGQLVLGAAPVGVAMAVLYSSNSWDVPIIAAALAALLVAQVSRIGWKPIAISLLATGVTALLTAGPFAGRYSSPAGIDHGDAPWPWTMIPGLEVIVASLGYVAWDRTTFIELIVGFGGFLALILIVILARFGSLVEAKRSHLLTLGALAGALATVAFLTATPALLLLGIPALLVIWLIISRSAAHESVEALVLTAIALLILVAIEFVYVRDPFGDRMNTVFKFSFQAWTAFAMALGALVPGALSKLSAQSSKWLLGLAAGLTGVTILLVAVYSPLSAYRWSSDFQTWHGIDGVAYLSRVQPDEFAAITWLGENVNPGANVLEAPGCAYGSDNFVPHSRVSMSTGLPTVIGWDGHERQWRRGQPERLAEIGGRIEHVRQIYEKPRESGPLVARYGIDYVFIGHHELWGYSQCAHGPPYSIPDEVVLEEAGWDRVFEQNAVRVYKLPEPERDCSIDGGR